MITQDHLKLVKGINVGDCFKLNDSPRSLYIRVDQLTVPELAPCLKLINGKIELLETDLLVYSVKARLIIDNN